MVGLLATAGLLQAQLAVVLTPSVPSPAPLGTVVTWTAAAFGGSGNYLYRFSASDPGLGSHVVRDYSPANTLDWTSADWEGSYTLRVTVQDSLGGVADASVPYQLTPLAETGPVITPTANPLVFIYSTPPCLAGSSMRVEFQGPDGFLQDTPYRTCRSGVSMNFYLAGLRPAATYAVHHTLDTGPVQLDRPVLTLTTPVASAQAPSVNVLEGAAPQPAAITLHSAFMGPSYAADPSGNLIWYYSAPLALLTRPESGGRFLALVSKEPAAGFGEMLREFDLAGNTLRETNTARINEQLTALGKRNIGMFHHDAIELPGGGIAVLGTTEQVMNGVQGSGSVDIIGDMILVLDANLRVVWTWDAFDYLDPHRAATLGETCPGIGCPPITQASHANDWLHGNALQMTADGNLLYSTRHQDWILKIDYRNGQGDGHILWRLGKDGDFTVIASDASPWFSHQHGPRFSPWDSTMLAVYDDSNLRYAANHNAQSRGQVWKLDEQNMTATLVGNANLGGFSFAMGDAQALRNGDYFFGGGWLPDNTSRAVETDGAGNQVEMVRIGNPEYRSFQMQNLYGPQSERVLPPPRLERAIRGLY